MFKYDEFPKIKAMHEKSRKKSADTYSAEFKLERSGGNSKFQRELEESADRAKNFDLTTYSQVIYEEVSPLKPVLTKTKTGEKVSWEEYFGSKVFDDLNEIQRKTLFMLVEYERPYRLPDKFYNDRDWFEEQKKKDEKSFLKKMKNKIK